VPIARLLVPTAGALPVLLAAAAIALRSDALLLAAAVAALAYAPAAWLLLSD
jgi:hypothetical protein